MVFYGQNTSEILSFYNKAQHTSVPLFKLQIKILLYKELASWEKVYPDR